MSDAGDDAAGALVGVLSAIAQPLAGKKLTKKLHKVVKKAAASKILKRGVKEVVKALRKSEKFKGCVGIPLLLASHVPACLRLSPPPSTHTSLPYRSLCIIAGDISPLDVISHLPVLCEDHSVPYVFVASKVGLGGAASTKRPTSCVLIPAGAKPGKGGEAWESGEKLTDCMTEVEGITPAR